MGMAQDGVGLLKRMIADHRQQASRISSRRSAPADMRAPRSSYSCDTTDNSGPQATFSVRGQDGRATKRGSIGESAPAPVRRKSSVEEGGSTETGTSCHSSGLTEYTESGLTFDEADCQSKEGGGASH